MTISGRQLDRIAQEVGEQLRAERDEQVERFRAGVLEPRVETRPALAVVEVDGGRLQVRGEGDGPGAHQAAWREGKIAILATMAPVATGGDPEPELPARFRDRGYVEGVIGALGGTGPMGPPGPEPEGPVVLPISAAPGPDEPRRRPELAVRTYVATTAPVDRFGPMVAAEARRRNFPEADGRAFLGDGSAWIWGLQRRYFPTFVPIVDFLHALGHIFAAARAVAADAEGRWELFGARAEAGWKGRVDQVIAELRTWHQAQAAFCGGAGGPMADDDPRRVVARVLGYLEENRERMDYPRYRREGLPWTTSHVESTVKMFNRRVKGSEKFWSEDGAEAMLQLRAAFLSEDGRLERHLKEQPSSPCRNYKARKTGKAA